MTDDAPDIYADSVWVAVRPFGVTITLTRSRPALQQGAVIPDETDIVARIRMSHALTTATIEALSNSMTQAAEAAQAAAEEMKKGTKH